MSYRFHNFDTHEAVKSFIASGINEKQAEAIVSTINDARNTELANLLTKADLAATRLQLQKELTLVRSELKQDIADIRSEMAAMKAELKQDIADVRGEMAAMRAELKQDIADVRGEMAAMRAELKQDIADLRAEMYSMKTTLIMWIVGGFAGSVGTMTSVMFFLLQYFMK